MRAVAVYVWNHPERKYSNDGHLESAHLVMTFMSFSPYNSTVRSDTRVIISGHYDSHGSFGSTRAPGGNDDVYPGNFESYCGETLEVPYGRGIDCLWR